MIVAPPCSPHIGVSDRRPKRVLVSIILLALSANVQAQDGPAREEADYNFDGHLDYRLPTETPGNQCGWWDYFLFDPDTSEHRLVVTSFCREEFDAEQRLVKTMVSGGMAGLIYAARHFRWEGFEPVAVFVEAQHYDPEHELFALTRVTNLDSISGPTVVSEIVSRDEAEANARARWGVR